MRKIVLISALALMLVASIGWVGCSCKPAIPEGSTTYALESIEPNNIGVTMESISEFLISLDASDNTYAANFKASGMPMYITETGTYEIKGSDIKFTKGADSRNTVISEGISYNSKDDTITVACLKTGASETYTAVFKKSNDASMATD